MKPESINWYLECAACGVSRGMCYVSRECCSGVFATETRDANGALKLSLCLEKYHTPCRNIGCGGVAANINFGWSWRVVWDSSVGIATRYGVNGAGIGSR